MTSKIAQIFTLIQGEELSVERKEIVQPLIEYINEQLLVNNAVQLNFICTHNSRRSQFAQVWAAVAADYHGINLATFSGGVEVTACHDHTVASFKRFGFKVEGEGDQNTNYQFSCEETGTRLTLFSKLFDHPENPTEEFAAIMTCSHADENCPFVPGCDRRISLTYEDPKIFDGSPIEASMYDARSYQIASEMFYVFSQIKKS